MRKINKTTRFSPQMLKKKILAAKQAAFVRPIDQYLTTVEGKITRLPLNPGAFNAGLVKHEDKYICVYRPDEQSFTACFLDKNLELDFFSLFPLKITNCADPRIIWVGKKLLMIYSSTEEGGFHHECIRGSIIMDLDKSDKFMEAKPFRISPKSKERQKNWTPFIYEDEVYLIASINPQIIYKLNMETLEPATLVHKTEWINPWFNKEFLRGNTNPVRLEDGNYLSTFHTVIKHGRLHLYDNGAYVFEGKPPFRVIKCSNKTYMKAEDAVEPHFRKKGLISVNFPVGMVREGEKILISYGDNDSAVKILETTVKQLTDPMLGVY
jgi:predicted GH43/DUF377 family glycosyl hydrolase